MSISLKIATLVWKITPSARIRRIYFSIFCWATRGRTRIIETDGYRLELDLGQTIDVAVYLGRFERELVSAIREYTKPGNVVLDVGANSGIHTIAFAQQVADGRVFAFEPMSFAYRKLRRNISLNPKLNVTPENIALSSENCDSLHVSFRASWRTDGIVDSHSDQVMCRRLDDWENENRLARLDIMKIDVDGFEFPVLEGGKGTIERFRPLIFMEVGAYHFEKPERNPILLLEGLGYSFWLASSRSHLAAHSMQELLESPAMNGTTINIIASVDRNFLS